MSIQLLEIEPSMLPLKQVEVYFNDGWNTHPIFFDNMEEAENYRQSLIQTAGMDSFSQNLADLQSQSIRVSDYTEEHFRRDLIKTIMADPDSVQRALNAFRTKTLIQIAK